MSDRPLVYLILGAAGSGRRELLADLVEGGLAAEDRPAVLLAESESADPADARLGAPGRWRATPDHRIEAALPEGATHIFFVADGRRNPVDQVETFKTWLESQPADLARIFCVIHCRLVEQHPPLRAWYDACVHFADVVFFNRREGVANKWFSDFRAHFQSQCLPCLFETPKGGKVPNPALVLDPQARRLSQAFDEQSEWADVEINDSDLDEEEAAAAAEEDGTPGEDPYLARHGGGRRIRELPDINKFL